MDKKAKPPPSSISKTPEQTLLKLHSVIPASSVNGPGRRLVVFFQGCARDCPGCFNKATHNTDSGFTSTVEDLFATCLPENTGNADNKDRKIDGLTVSGGEPFLQIEGLFELLKTARERYSLTTLVYTGFTIEEIRKDPGKARVLKHTDVLVDGPFEQENPEPTLLARGSKNQRVHLLTGAYTRQDMVMPGKVEIIITNNGDVVTTGFSKVTTQNTTDGGNGRKTEKTCKDR